MSDESDQASQSESPSTDGCWGRLAAVEALTPETFDPYVGEVFRVTYQPFETTQTHVSPLHVGDGSQDQAEEVVVELELVEVTRHPRIEEREGGFDDRPRDPFSLLFAGPAEPVLISAMHIVEHDQLGRARIYFNPVQGSLKRAKESSGAIYESVFG